MFKKLVNNIRCCLLKNKDNYKNKLKGDKNMANVNIKEIKYYEYTPTYWYLAINQPSNKYYKAGQKGYQSYITQITFSISESIGDSGRLKFSLPTSTKNNSTWISKSHTFTGFVLSSPVTNYKYLWNVKSQQRAIARLKNEQEAILTDIKSQVGTTGYLIFDKSTFIGEGIQPNTTYYLYICPTKIDGDTFDFDPYTWWQGEREKITAVIENQSIEQEEAKEIKSEIHVYNNGWKRVESIYVYKNGKWCSVIDSKIYKNNAWKDIAETTS